MFISVLFRIYSIGYCFFCNLIDWVVRLPRTELLLNDNLEQNPGRGQ